MANWMVNFEFQTEPVDELEDVVGVFYGGRGQVGQQYVLTNRRLLMGPVDTGVATEIDAYVLNQAVPGGGDLVKSVLGKYGPMNPKTLWLRHVVDVQPTTNAGWFKMASLQITTDTEQVFELGFVKTPTTMNRNKENNDVRDRAVQVIRAAVDAAKAAPAPPV
jgi:hypothetical protein